jgi:hypothetical protein
MKADRREMKAHHEEMMAGIKRMNATLRACPEKMEACLEEKKESTLEETETVAEPEEVPERATKQETSEAAEDRTGEQRRAVGCSGRLKTRTKRDGRLRQECAATVGRPTRRFVPALRKEGLRKGPGKECRSGIRRPGRTFRSRIDGRSLKQRQIKDNVVRGTAKGRTCEKKDGGARYSETA